MTTDTILKRIVRKNLGFYTSAQASRIALIPHWTLTNWRHNGIIIPTVTWVDEFHKEHVGHTFDTVIFMRLLRLLRDKGISLYNAVTAMQQLKQRFGYPSKSWSRAKLFVYGKHIYVYEDRDRDKWGVTEITRYNQRVAEFVFGDEFVLLKQRADALLIPERFINYVEIDPVIQNGLPIVLGTKILTSAIHELSIQGYRPNDIQQMYPFIPESRIEGVEDYEKFLDNPNLN